MGKGIMTTDEPIRALREIAEKMAEWSAKEFETDGDLMLKATNRLEELDERVAIMSEANKTDP